VKTYLGTPDIIGMANSRLGLGKWTPREKMTQFSRDMLELGAKVVSSLAKENPSFYHERNPDVFS
jgi:hypothetical protein